MHYSFAPGPVPDAHRRYSWSTSHRSDDFRDLWLDTVRRLQELTGFEQAILVMGSASAAIETVLGSLRNRRIDMLTSGEFSNRVKKWLGQRCENIEQTDLMYAVQFETAQSKFWSIDEQLQMELAKQNGRLTILDVVSGYPYYSIPSCIDVAIISSSKLLRGMPAMGIALLRKKELLEQFTTSDSEYLDLKTMASASEQGQSPHTALIPQVVTLHECLLHRVWEKPNEAIATNCRLLVQGRESKFIGETEAPVLTLRCLDRDALLQYAKNQNVEIYANKRYAGDTVQMAAYSYERSEPYLRLNEILEHAEKEGWT